MKAAKQNAYVDNLARQTKRNNVHLKRGAAAIEFSLILPVLLFLFATIAEWGRFTTHSLRVHHAVREGARTASSLGISYTKAESQSAIEAIAEETVIEQLKEAGISFEEGFIEARVFDQDGQLFVTVQCNLPYEALVSLVPHPGALTGSQTMLLEAGF